MMPLNLERRGLIAASVIVPFVLQFVVAFVAFQGGPGGGGYWVWGSMLPVLAGFVFLERALHLYAAPLALVYFPVMLWLLFFFTLTILGLVTGAHL